MDGNRLIRLFWMWAGFVQRAGFYYVGCYGVAEGLPELINTLIHPLGCSLATRRCTQVETNINMD